MEKFTKEKLAVSCRGLENRKMSGAAVHICIRSKSLFLPLKSKKLAMYQYPCLSPEKAQGTREQRNGLKYGLGLQVVAISVANPTRWATAS